MFAFRRSSTFPHVGDSVMRTRIRRGVTDVCVLHRVLSVGEIRWDEKAGLRRDAVRSQVIDVLKAQEIKETGNEEG